MIIDDFNTPPSIECRSENGNPAAGLKWVNGNTRRDLQGNYTTVNDTMQANKTQTAILQLQERLDDTWQGAVLVCVASHSTYEGQNHIAYVTIHKPRKYLDQSKFLNNRTTITFLNNKP